MLGYVETDQFAAHDLEVKELSHYDQLKGLSPWRQKVHPTVPKGIMTGSVVYRINADHSLTLVAANYDTSD